MKKLFCYIPLMVLPLLVVNRSYGQPSKKKILPTSQQVQWADAEIGVLIHLDMNIFAPDTYHYGQKTTLPPLSDFNPSRLNTDQWIAAAKSAGAKYAVLVAKHGTGFSLWPTKANNYTISHTPWKNGRGDIVAEFIKSCKKYGIKPGIYYSINSNALYNVRNDMPDSAREKYNKVVLQQVTEISGHYGPLFEIWFDGGIRPTSEGGVSDQITALVKKYQSRAILFQGPASCKNLIRWVGNENGVAPYPMWSGADITISPSGQPEIKDAHGDPDGSIWCPAESDFPIRKNSAWEAGWFWRAGREEDILPVSSLVDKYYTTVGRNTNMLIGMVIDTAGQFPENESRVFATFGKEIKKRFSKSIAETKGSGQELILRLGSHPMKVNTVVLMESIAHGENIRKYFIEAWVNGQWKSVCDGTSVGHERIQQFTPVLTTKLRLQIRQADQTPIVKKFAAYNIM